jgi:hypothetical protein
MAVRQETLHRSWVSMKTRERMIHQYVRKKFDPDVVVSCYETPRGLGEDPATPPFLLDRPTSARRQPNPQPHT